MLRVHTQISSMLLITPRVSCCLLSISRCPPPSVERKGGIISPRARPQGRLSDIFVKFAQRRQIASRSLDLNRLKIPSPLFHDRLSRLIIKQAAPKSRLQPCEKRAFGQTCNVHDGRKACNWPLPRCSFNTVPGSSPKATKSRMPSRPRHLPYPNHACRLFTSFPNSSCQRRRPCSSKAKRGSSARTTTSLIVTKNCSRPLPLPGG